MGAFLLHKIFYTLNTLHTQYGEILPHSLHKTIDLPYKILWHTLCIIPNEAGKLTPGHYTTF